MASRKLDFTNHQGLRLSALLDFPADQKPLAYAIFAHCFTCNKNWTAARNISRALASKGVAVLRFDFSGLGASEGEFVESSFSSNITDILAASEFLASDYEAPSLLIGHSLGGAAVLSAGQHLPHIKGIVTVGAPSEPGHVLHLLKGAIKEIEALGSATVHIGGRPFEIGKSFLDDIKDQDFENEIGKLDKALLILHSPQDTVVNIDQAKALYHIARHPKSFISLDGADHLLTDALDSTYVGDVIASWASRYLERKQEKNLRTDLEVIVSLQDQDQFTTLIKAGDHYLTADEPETVGGNNFGATPYQLLSSALGACTAMTLKMYAVRKKWDLQEVKVHLQYDKVYARDCLHCIEDELKGIQPNQRLDHIDRDIELLGNLNIEQRERLLQIANKCPVHKTLENKMFVHTRLKETASVD